VFPRQAPAEVLHEEKLLLFLNALLLRVIPLAACFLAIA
jgi:hypothetical protein